MTAQAQASFGAIAKAATGIVFCGSLIKPADVTDGTSNTYLLGEKISILTIMRAVGITATTSGDDRR